jgi:hypothetical protein
MDWYELRLDPHHIGVPSGVFKMIYEPMVRSVLTVHLSCADINTISIWTKMSFHLTHFTREFHRLCAKWFPSLLHVSRKPCTDIVWRLTLSPTGPKRASTWPTSWRSTIGCGQNWWDPVGFAARSFDERWRITRLVDGDDVHSLTTTVQWHCALATDTPPPMAAVILRHDN